MALARNNLITAFAIVGILGPILFVFGVTVQSIINPDYNHVLLPISALAAWPSGWIQNLTFFVFGFLFAIFAIGLHLGISTSRQGILGVGLLVLAGFGVVFAGVFPWALVDGQFLAPRGHIIATVVAFLSVGIGFIILSRRLLLDDNWQRLAPHALLTGVFILVFFLVFGILARPQDALLHAWGGFIQRMMLGVWFGCTILLSIRLWRTAASRK